VRHWTKSTQSVSLSVKYHSLKTLLFTRPSITWLLIPTYSTSIPFERSIYKSIGIC